jgi:hypothetical protein
MVMRLVKPLMMLFAWRMWQNHRRNRTGSTPRRGLFSRPGL